MSRTLILHDYNAKKRLTNWRKKNKIFFYLAHIRRFFNDFFQNFLTFPHEKKYMRNIQPLVVTNIFCRIGRYMSNIFLRNAF